MQAVYECFHMLNVGLYKTLCPHTTPYHLSSTTWHDKHLFWFSQFATTSQIWLYNPIGVTTPRLTNTALVNDVQASVSPILLLSSTYHLSQYFPLSLPIEGVERDRRVLEASRQTEMNTSKQSAAWNTHSNWPHRWAGSAEQWLELQPEFISFANTLIFPLRACNLFTFFSPSTSAFFNPPFVASSNWISHFLSPLFLHCQSLSFSLSLVNIPQEERQKKKNDKMNIHTWLWSLRSKIELSIVQHLVVFFFNFKLFPTV